MRKRMRLFIALKFDKTLTDALISMQDAIWDAGVDGNYTKEENLHLTLAFIGEYGDPDAVLRVLENVRFDPVKLSLERLGAFEGLWWAGLSESPVLSAYVKRLRHALACARIPFDKKRFSPHITLIRNPSKPKMPKLDAMEASMIAHRVSLMRSDRGKNGMIYTEIGYVDVF